MRKYSILECISLVGTIPSSFDGEKVYVSTGAVNCNYIDHTKTELITYQNRPSRANLSANKGDILFAKMCDTQKTLYIDSKNSEYIFSTGFFAVRPNKNVVMPKLLYYILDSNQFLKQKDLHCSGATQKAITNTGLKKIKISIPPLDKQPKIISVLDKINHLITKRRQQLDKLDEMIKSKFVEMFGAPETNTKNWRVLPMSKICSVGSSKRIYQSEQSSSGVPFWRISDLISLITTGTVTPELYIPEERYKELKTQGQVPTLGDILITSRGTLGQCYIVKVNDEFYFQDGMISWLSGYMDGVTPLYISYLFTMPGFRKQIDSMQAGSTVSYLSIAMIKKLKVMVPDLGSQQQFSFFVSKTEKTKNTINQSLEKLETLKKALMQEYFG